MKNKNEKIEEVMFQLLLSYRHSDFSQVLSFYEYANLCLKIEETEATAGLVNLMRIENSLYENFAFDYDAEDDENM